jgi:hypothetical protein
MNCLGWEAMRQVATSEDGFLAEKIINGPSEAEGY